MNFLTLAVGKSTSNGYLTATSLFEVAFEEMNTTYPEVMRDYQWTAAPLENSLGACDLSGIPDSLKYVYLTSIPARRELTVVFGTCKY